MSDHDRGPRAAEAISIAEFDDLVVVGGVGKTEGYEQGQIKPIHLLLKGDDVEFMLNEAFRRRAPVPSRYDQHSGLRGLFRSSRRPLCLEDFDARVRPEQRPVPVGFLPDGPRLSFL